jgi:nicotinamide-nucleotide amidase
VFDPETLALAESVLALCRSRRWRLATAESCTGGLVAAALTAIAGASNTVECGFVTYANRTKIELLGVPPETITEHGAVSAETAAAMARGAVARAGVDLGVSVTGVAGPGGGTPQKPVGMVCVAVLAGDREWVRTFQFVGDRALVKYQSATAALNMLRLLILGKV